jgi:hypothetical protein
MSALSRVDVAIVEMVRRATVRRAVENDRRIRTLLRGWVSEVEPSVCFDADGFVVGLTRPGGGAPDLTLPL